MITVIRSFCSQIYTVKWEKKIQSNLNYRSCRHYAQEVRNVLTADVVSVTHNNYLKYNLLIII